MPDEKTQGEPSLPAAGSGRWMWATWPMQADKPTRAEWHGTGWRDPCEYVREWVPDGATPQRSSTGICREACKHRDCPNDTLHGSSEAKRKKIQ